MDQIGHGLGRGGGGGGGRGTVCKIDEQYQWPSNSVLNLTRVVLRRVHLPQL